RNEVALAKVAQEIGAAWAIRQDVTQVSDCRRGVERAAERLGGLDILINNAGIEQVKPSLEVDEEIWDRILDTNLKGAFFWAQGAPAAMRAAGTGGSIVNLCSLTSYRGIPTAAPYTASKSGLLGMTRALSAEWAPMKIRVNGLAPGYFRTELTEIFYRSQDWQQAMLQKIPQGRFAC